MSDETAAKPEVPALDAAAPVEAPATEADQPQPDPVAELEARIGGRLTETEKRLLGEVRTAQEAARRAQSSADSNAGRLKRDFESRLARIEALATRGLDENELRDWNAQRKIAELEAKSTEVDAAERDRADRQAFTDFSAALLAEEKIDAQDPVLTAAFQRFAATGKDLSDWKVALTRAVAEVRKDEGNKKAAAAAEKAAKVIEDERKKATNARRENGGPVDSGPVGSTTRKNPNDMTDEEFTAFWAEKKQERERRRVETLR